MNLTEEYIANLKLIYGSENQSVNRTEFIDEDGNLHPEPEKIISELVELDCIETETDENVFFLTTYGFDCVEQLTINGTKENYNRNEIQTDTFNEFVNRIGEKNFKKYIFIWLISFGIFVAVCKFFFPRSLEF